MTNEKYSQEELKQLAAAVVEKILGDKSLSKILARRLEAARKGKDDCPEWTLCCSKNYVCPEDFSCDEFRCSNGHTENLQGRALSLKRDVCHE